MSSSSHAPNPAITGQTLPGNASGVTTVQVKPKRKVTYIVVAASSNNLSIPYAVAVDGAAQAAFSNKPKRVSGKSGRIETFVEQGSKVSLFLNSDAHPSYRKNAVYEVTVASNDVIVTITEKSGKHADTDTPKLQTAKADEKPPLDRYTAPLTGDIWMKVSHKYTAAEVDALVEAVTSEAVKTAVKFIYNGLNSTNLSVTESAIATTSTVPAKGAQTVQVTFQNANNPKDNIRAFSLLSDGLPRVHPAGYAAMLTAALENGITSLTVSSCWRPMLGSIAHRAGLGLDVAAVGGTKMNRQELRNAFSGKNPAKKGNANDADNVSESEIARFGEYEDGIVATKKKRADVDAVNQALKLAEKTGDPAAITAATAKRRDALAALNAASQTERDALRDWNHERDQAEPANARLFRTSLLKCRCIGQLFDPWFMDANTLDETSPEPNMQRGASTSNERLHGHHLHITVHEPKIL